MPDPVDRLNAALVRRYRVERQLGEGGMATVYLADDLKHERRVAVKLLKPELAAVVGAERFLAEIKTTANLHHPHILPLFDSGEADGFLFYVMPYVEGETLRQRLDRERQLPVDEAVAITTAIAQALQHAHERGVIHRDIKPGNILLQDGQPVVSDFGIALAVGSAGGARLTETGLSVGTPFYMSPEQATGDQHVGPASDTYALACVLYEMLTGDPPYIGSTAQAVLGKIIQGAPVSATATRSSVPPNVDAAIRRALEKLPADRFASARDFARALTDTTFRHGHDAAVTAMNAGPWRRLAIGVSAVAVLVSGVAAVSLFSTAETAPGSVVRFTVDVGEGADLWLGGVNDAARGRPTATSLALSPDGKLLAYTAWSELPDGEVGSRLYLRRFDQERADAVAGTEGASTPFFSPDGAWIGFFVGRSLRRTRFGGGSVETIVAEADVPGNSPRGASWGDDGTIVYGGTAGIWRVAASGGEPSVIAEEPSEAYRSSEPLVLPGTRAVLFTGWASYNPNEAEIAAVDLATRTVTTLLTDAMHPRFLETGHLLFVRRGTLMAVGFDPERLEVLGQPFLVLENVMQAVGGTLLNAETGAAQVAVSPVGHLAYASGGVHPETRRELIRVSLDGRVEPLIPGYRDYFGARVSPEGGRLAFSTFAGPEVRIFIHDLARGVTEPLPTGFRSTPFPTWSPDGRRIAFSSPDEGEFRNMYRMPVDGSAAPERVVPSERTQDPASWSVDGVLAYQEGGDIWILPPDGAPAPFFTSSANENFVAFSPDGRWLAYTSSQSGRSEVYVRPYPGPDPATRISVDGGTAPAWSPDGNRVYFFGPGEGGRAMWVAEVAPGAELGVRRPSVLIDPWPYATSNPVRGYDVLPDGSFMTARYVDEGAEDMRTFHRVSEVHVVLNFADELRRRGQR